MKICVCVLISPRYNNNNDKNNNSSSNNNTTNNNKVYKSKKYIAWT